MRRQWEVRNFRENWWFLRFVQSYNQNSKKQDGVVAAQYPYDFKGEICVLVDSTDCPALKNEIVTAGLALYSQICALKT